MNDLTRLQFAFRQTVSEKRILHELLRVAALRQMTKEDCVAQETDTAATYIARLKAKLFPEETRLAAERTKLLQDLQTSFAKFHFDQDLETATITIQAKIGNDTEYRELLDRLHKFDFSAWQEHCTNERSHAD